MHIGLGGVILVRGRRGVWVTGDLGSVGDASPEGVALAGENMFQSMGTRGINRIGTTVPNKPNKEMTSTQRLAWIAYRGLAQKHDAPPTVRQFMVQLDLKSSGAAHRYIDIFRAQGLIKTEGAALTTKGRKTR